jgi:hypothetical protein
MSASVGNFASAALGAGLETTKRLARLAVVLTLMTLLAYCCWTAWGVLGELQRVKLSDVKSALDVVTVRDAVLCGVGFLLGRELLRAVVRMSRPD